MALRTAIRASEEPSWHLASFGGFTGDSEAAGMFVTACEESEKFTRPVVISWRRWGGEIASNVGAYVLLNGDGWALTAGHMLKDLPTMIDEEKQSRAIVQQLDEVEALGLPETQKRKKLRAIARPPAMVRNVSTWWGVDGVRLENMTAYGSVDLAVVKLAGDFSGFTGFPRFRRAAGIKAGTTFVKVGYPFPALETKWNETNNAFELEGELSPFPLEGMHTRVLAGGTDPDGFPIMFVESSSPGLRGQSGGPWLDRDGAVFAIQSSTEHLQLGFNAKDGAGKVIEQFLNVGRGVHPETLEAILAKHGVAVDWTDQRVSVADDMESGSTT